MNENKIRAGRAGGLCTASRYGRTHMQEIGRRGAAATWRRCRLIPVGVSGWAMIARATGKVKAIWGAT